MYKISEDFYDKEVPLPLHLRFFDYNYDGEDKKVEEALAEVEENKRKLEELGL